MYFTGTFPKLGQTVIIHFTGKYMYSDEQGNVLISMAQRKVGVTPKSYEIRDLFPWEILTKTVI